MKYVVIFVGVLTGVWIACLFAVDPPAAWGTIIGIFVVIVFNLIRLARAT